MNVREGMRRLGILLGVSGGVLGGCLAYNDAKATWENHAAYRQFASIVASPTMQQVAKATHDYLKPSKFGGIRVVESHALTYAANGTIWEAVAENSAHGPWEKYQRAPGGKFVPPPIEDQSAHPGTGQRTPAAGPWEKAARSEDWKLWTGNAETPATLPRDFFDNPGAIVVSVNLAGVKRVAVNETGLVFAIETSTGAWVNRANAPDLKAYLVPLFFPILGFLLPWGSIRVVTWVGSGFVEPRR